MAVMASRSWQPNSVNKLRDLLANDTKLDSVEGRRVQCQMIGLQYLLSPKNCSRYLGDSRAFLIL